MKRSRFFISALTIFLGFISLGGFSEGSKQLNKGCQLWSTYLYLCNDFTNHCTDTNGIRSQFATYDETHHAPDNSKLYFVARANEVVYMGFNGSPTDTSAGLDIVYRICDSSGAVVYAEDYLPKVTGATGYIPGLSEACDGPDQISSTGNGYNAIESGRHQNLALIILNFQRN